MMRFFRTLCTAWVAILPLALIPATIAHAQTTMVPEKTSTGLLTFSDRDRVMRVAIVFAGADDAVVDTIVRFVDARGHVLKARRGNLRDGAPFIAELTRTDVGDLAEVLVRAEVFHNLPGTRPAGYPIVTTLQAISADGSSRHAVGWNGGLCAAIFRHTDGKPMGGGVWYDCYPTLPDTPVPSRPE